MRMIVGCTLGAAEAEAIKRGESLRDAVAGCLLRMPLSAPDAGAIDALELLAWGWCRGAFWT